MFIQKVRATSFFLNFLKGHYNCPSLIRNTNNLVICLTVFHLLFKANINDRDFKRGGVNHPPHTRVPQQHLTPPQAHLSWAHSCTTKATKLLFRMVKIFFQTSSSDHFRGLTHSSGYTCTGNCCGYGPLERAVWDTQDSECWHRGSFLLSFSMTIL